MKFLILVSLIVAASAQLPSLPIGGGNNKDCFDREVVDKFKSKVAEVRENVDQALDYCCQASKKAQKDGSPISQSEEAPKITEYAKKAFDANKEMQTDKDKIRKQVLKRPPVSCVLDAESNNNQMAGLLLPFSQLTSKTPDSVWEKLCGEDAKEHDSCKNMNSTTAKGPTTKMAYKYIENMEYDLAHIERCEECTPTLPIGN